MNFFLLKLLVCASYIWVRELPCAHDHADAIRFYQSDLTGYSRETQLFLSFVLLIFVHVVTTRAPTDSIMDVMKKNLPFLTHVCQLFVLLCATAVAFNILFSYLILFCTIHGLHCCHRRTVCNQPKQGSNAHVLERICHCFPTEPVLLSELEFNTLMTDWRSKVLLFPSLNTCAYMIVYVGIRHSILSRTLARTLFPLLAHRWAASRKYHRNKMLLVDLNVGHNTSTVVKSFIDICARPLDDFPLLVIWNLKQDREHARVSLGQMGAHSDLVRCEEHFVFENILKNIEEALRFENL